MGDVVLLILHSLDVFILELVNLSYHNFLLDNLALLITNFGVIYLWIVVSIILYLFGNKKGKTVAKRMIILLVATTIITQIIKFVVMRPRPYEELSSLVLLSVGTDPSFPSGHTATSTAMAYLLSKEYNKYYLMLIPFIVALSRLYLGVHYPSDVLGGFILGIFIAYFIDYLYFKLN